MYRKYKKFLSISLIILLPGISFGHDISKSKELNSDKKNHLISKKNNISSKNNYISESCLDSSGIFYAYNLNYHNSTFFDKKVDFLYNPVDSIIPPHHFINKSISAFTNLKAFFNNKKHKNSMCYKPISFHGKDIESQLTLKNVSEILTFKCPENSFYAFKNDMSSISCIDRKGNLKNIKFTGSLRKKQNKNLFLNSVVCENGRFLKVGNSNISNTGFELTKSLSTAWVCAKKNSLRPHYCAVKNYGKKDAVCCAYDKINKVYDCGVFTDSVYFYCNLDHVLKISKSLDLLDSDFQNMCVKPQKEKAQNILTIGCNNFESIGYSYDKSYLTCLNPSWNILVSSINSINFSTPVNFKSLACIGGGIWKQLDKEKYKNKKINGYVKNGLVWQKWGCVQEEKILDKVKKLL